MEMKDLCQVKDVLATIVQLEARIRRETGLSLNQALVLCCLSQCSLTPTQLAAQLRIPVPSLSRLLGTLVGRQLTIRHPSQDDARQTLVSLTPSGQLVAARLQAWEHVIFPLAVTDHPLLPPKT